MTWPTGAIPTTALDQGTDVPPRAVFLDWAIKFNQLISHVSAFMQPLLESTDAPAARTVLDVYSRSQVDAAVQAAVPASTIAYFPRTTPPNGWLKANGAAVSRTTYAALFASIGTTFGVGDGTTTFNLPDLRGEFARGWDDGRGIDAGRALGTGQASANLSHSHSMTSAGDHLHSTGIGATVSAESFFNTAVLVRSAGTTNTGTAGAHTHTINADGGSEARPRNVALLACIKF